MGKALRATVTPAGLVFPSTGWLWTVTNGPGLGQAWAYDPVGASAGQRIPFATFCATQIRVNTALASVSGIELMVLNQATGVTAASGLALYSSMAGTPKLLAQCGVFPNGYDISSALQTVGFKALNFGDGQTNATNLSPKAISLPVGLYTVVYWNGSGTLAPGIARGHNQPNIVNGGAKGLRFATDAADWAAWFGGGVTGATPAPATLPGLAAGSGTPQASLWAGLY